MRTNETKTVETVVAVIDNLGRLYCSDCAAELNAIGDAVYFGSHPHSLESCDRCGKPVEK